MFQGAIPTQPPESLLSGSARALLAVEPILPRHADLAVELADTRAAEARGYFLPDEDQRVRSAFARYLVARAVLHQTVQDLRPLREGRGVSRDLSLQAFTVAFCAACMLMRAGRFMVDSFSEAPVVREKLDEAEPTHGIPAGQFTAVYRSLTRPLTTLRFLRAAQFARLHRSEIAALKGAPAMEPVLRLLAEEEAWLEAHPLEVAGRFLRYRIDAIQRAPKLRLKRVLFGLFKASGSAIAELRNPWKRKRVTPRIRRRLAALLQPGDVLITRHDDAMTNLFLPGYWPHGALYIGSLAEREALGVTCDPERAARSGGAVRVLEARKDGVRFRALADTLSVDCVAVLRPRLDPAALARCLGRALTHEGKLYDFEFDFRRSDRMVCTEVIYRGFHGEPPIAFSLASRFGRLCLSAEDLVAQALDGNAFDVVAVYGVRLRRLVLGGPARTVMEQSLHRGAAG